MTQISRVCGDANATTQTFSVCVITQPFSGCEGASADSQTLSARGEQHVDVHSCDDANAMAQLFSTCEGANADPQTLSTCGECGLGDVQFRR
jgi:hypothetical protein